MHHIKYYDVGIDLRQKKTVYSFGLIPTIGTSLMYNKVKFKFDIVWLKMIRLCIGYDIAKITHFSKKHKLFLYLNYSIVDYFFTPTDLYGLELSFQFKKFEFYYNIQKYRRFLALEAQEHQHMLGVKYNLFKERN